MSICAYGHPAREMAKLHLPVPDWNHFELLSPPDVDSSDPEPVVVNPLLKYLAFRGSRPGGFFGKEFDAYLRYPDSQPTSAIKADKEYLCGHPIACRSFATFIPLRNMVFLPFKFIEAVSLHYTTVWDVQSAFQDQCVHGEFLETELLTRIYSFDNTITVSEMSRYLRLVHDYQSAFSSDCDILDVFRTFQTLRGFFSYL